MLSVNKENVFIELKRWVAYVPKSGFMIEVDIPRNDNGRPTFVTSITVWDISIEDKILRKLWNTRDALSNLNCYGADVSLNFLEETCQKLNGYVCDKEKTQTVKIECLWSYSKKTLEEIQDHLLEMAEKIYQLLKNKTVLKEEERNL